MDVPRLCSLCLVQTCAAVYNVVKCGRNLGTDSVQLYQGTGIGSSGSRLVLGFCGVRRTMAPRAVRLRCHSSSLTLESSGLFYNMVQFSFLPTDPQDHTVC
ncbi:hypothetical protein PoB_002230100 [Plakobranchus ocellatus]|uniref:Secreted protein n=1 Tax=Plakobranchus ocellatus TaxID=259542 RepID=A0AAV3Z920_9GAST|nr:hypothetical protein PoB_002230100 [Plakobranchus ocellatus]